MLHFVHREANLACVESNSLSVQQTHAFPVCFPFDLLLIVFKDPVLTHFLLVHREVHHFLRARREAREEASRDHVTGVCGLPAAAALARKREEECGSLTLFIVRPLSFLKNKPADETGGTVNHS